MKPPSTSPPSGAPEERNPFDELNPDIQAVAREFEKKKAETERSRAAYEQAQASKFSDVRGGEVRTLGAETLTPEERDERLRRFVEDNRQEREDREERRRRHLETIDQLAKEAKGQKGGKGTGRVPNPTQQRAFDAIEEQRLAEHIAADDEAVKRGEMTEVEARARKFERQAKFLADQLRRSERAQLEAPLQGVHKGKGQSKEPRVQS